MGGARVGRARVARLDFGRGDEEVLADGHVWRGEIACKAQVKPSVALCAGRGDDALVWDGRAGREHDGREHGRGTGARTCERAAVHKAGSTTLAERRRHHG